MAIGEVNMSSKRYPEEFKIEAIRQVVDRGYSIAEVADGLGTTTHSLYSAWVRYTLLRKEAFYVPCGEGSVTPKGGVRRYYIYILRRLEIP